MRSGIHGLGVSNPTASRRLQDKSLLHNVNEHAPPTAGQYVQGRGQHSPERSCLENGGARRIRTDDLKLAKLALSQLSYGPAGITA
jgi:hypothetical protein